MDLVDNPEEPQFKLLELVHALVQRKMFIFKCTFVAACIAVGYTLTLPNIYSATAKVLPPQKEGGPGLSALIGQAGGLAGLAASGLAGGSDLYVGILKSRSVADGVIQRLDLVKAYNLQTLDQTRSFLAPKIRIQAGKDGIISITADDTDANRAALLANAYVEELGRTTVRLNLSKAGNERSFLEKRLDLVKKDLQEAEDDLKQFAQANKIVQVESQAKASIESIARMKADLASREVQLSVLRSKQTENSPEVKAVQRGVSELKNEIGRLAGSSSGGEGIPSVGNVPRVGLEYARRMRVVKTQEAILEQLTKQYEVAKLSEAKDSSSFQILDQAVVPTTKSKPSRSMMVILSTFSAFLLSSLCVLIQDHLGKMSGEDREIINNIKSQVFRLKDANN